MYTVKLKYYRKYVRYSQRAFVSQKYADLQKEEVRDLGGCWVVFENKVTYALGNSDQCHI